MGKQLIELVELFFLTVIAFLTLVGNCLVILAFIFGPRSIRSYTNYFVVNLAVSDLMVGCLSVPFWMVYRAAPTLVSETLYTYFIALDILCGTVSIACLAAISLERMFAVKFATHHYNLTRTPVILTILATWSFGLLFTGLKFTANDPDRLRTYTTSIFVLAFLVPLQVIILSYCIIFYIAKHMMQASNQPGEMVRELRVAKTISVIITLFFVCWAPFFIINMVYVYCDNFCDDHPRWVIYISKMMHYSNSMMNFFVYAVRSPDFRSTFKRMIFKCDFSRVREKLRTFSENMVSRSRTASERLSFTHDANHNHQHLNGNHENGKTRLITPKNKLKMSRLSNNSNHSYCTDVSLMDDHSNSSNASSYTQQTSLLENGTVQVFVTGC